MKKITDDLIERLAFTEHERWSNWMIYLFSITELTDKGAVIPNYLVERWTRQLNTSYFNLSEEEKESDRKEVRKTLIELSRYFDILSNT